MLVLLKEIEQILVEVRDSHLLEGSVDVVNAIMDLKEAIEAKDGS